MNSHTQLLAAIEAEVTAIRTRFSLPTTGRAFMSWYATVDLDLSEEQAEEAAGYDGANDKSIDFF